MERARRQRRSVRAAIAVLVAAVAPAAFAQTAPMRVYPLSGIEGTPRSAVADAQSLLESAAAAMLRRGENLRPATPLLLRPSCGRVPEITCLARLAGEGVVVFGAVHAADGILAVNLRAVDARARVIGPVRIGVDAVIQSSEPFLRALLALDARVGLAPSAPSAAAPRKALGDVLRSPAARAPSRGPPAAGGWQRAAGKLLLAGGVALAGAGAGFGLLDRRLSDSLEGKFQAGTLTAADAESYRRVDRYNTAATMLLAAGAVSATAGATLWILAPDVTPTPGGVRIGVSGRF